MRRSSAVNELQSRITSKLPSNMLLMALATELAAVTRYPEPLRKRLRRSRASFSRPAERTSIFIGLKVNALELLRKRQNTPAGISVVSHFWRKTSIRAREFTRAGPEFTPILF